MINGPAPSCAVQSLPFSGLVSVFDPSGYTPAFSYPAICQAERVRCLGGTPISYRIRIAPNVTLMIDAAFVTPVDTAHLAALPATFRALPQSVGPDPL